jgi:hypothetical protein
MDYNTQFTPAQRINEALTNKGWKWVYEAAGPRGATITLWTRGTDMLIQTTNREGKCGLFAPVSRNHDADEILRFVNARR